MTRRIIMLSVLTTLAISMLGFVGCTKSNSVLETTGTEIITKESSFGVMETTPLRTMTVEDISRLIKQESLSWSDFNAYVGEDIGSGLFVFKYNLVDGGYLLVSGSSLEENPQRIVYYHSDGEEEQIK